MLVAVQVFAKLLQVQMESGYWILIMLSDLSKEHLLDMTRNVRRVHIFEVISVADPILQEFLLMNIVYVCCLVSEALPTVYWSEDAESLKFEFVHYKKRWSTRPLSLRSKCLWLSNHFMATEFMFFIKKENYSQ